jgi:HEAT repeat protein
VALGLLGGSDIRITRFLTQLVEHVNIPEVKAAAALALSKIGSTPEALKTLRKAITDRNQYVKMSAIVALGYFRDFSTVTDLQKVYASATVAEQRALTVVALGFIGETATIPVLRELTLDFNHLSVFQRMPAVDMILRLF